MTKERFSEAKDRLGDYFYLEVLFGDLRVPEKRSVARALTEMVKRPKSKERLQVLNAVYGAGSSIELTSNLQDEDISHRRLRSALSDPLNFALLDTTPANADIIFPKAATLSYVPLEAFPQRLKEAIAATPTDSGISLRQKGTFQYLCPQAEDNMDIAMDNETTLLVNGSLLVKDEGRLTSLCTETFSNRAGYAFLEGNWYSPYDERLRSAIRNGLHMGKEEIAMQAGVWQLMRPVENDELLERAKYHAGNGPYPQ